MEVINHIPENHIERKVNEYISVSGCWDWVTLETLLPEDMLLHLAAFKINNATEEELGTGPHQVPFQPNQHMV